MAERRTENMAFRLGGLGRKEYREFRGRQYHLWGSMGSMAGASRQATVLRGAGKLVRIIPRTDRTGKYYDVWYAPKN